MSTPDVSTVPLPPSIWVQRWEWSLQPVGDNACTVTPVATCQWYQADTVLPAVCDWPRWKSCKGNSLPPDEYYEVTWLPEYTMPTDPSSCCGPVPIWKASWKRIPTPRAFRWVASQCPCDAPPQSQASWAA